MVINWSEMKFEQVFIYKDIYLYLRFLVFAICLHLAIYFLFLLLARSHRQETIGQERCSHYSVPGRKR